MTITADEFFGKDLKVYDTKMTETEKLKAQIQELQEKLEELEKTKSPVEEAFKRIYKVYPSSTEKSVFWTDTDEDTWIAFQNGYKQAQKDYKVGEYQEPEKEPVSLYKRFENEGAYGMISFEDALKVVREFLMDEGVIEYESGEQITFTLPKSLLDVPND